MPPHRVVAVGGTFDYLHKGHEKLILNAFQKGESVVIGITSDEFLERVGKEHDQSLEERFSRLKDFLNREGLLGRARIVILNDPYGPTIKDPSIEGVVVTQETVPRAEETNKIRRDLGMPEMKIYVVNYVVASDGLPISSTRIRNREIDEKGNLIKY
ncbi:MAG: phosphopantetheine adenylyltransferase [Candidatus Methanomethylicaceae archaeon]